MVISNLANETCILTTLIEGFPSCWVARTYFIGSSSTRTCYFDARTYHIQRKKRIDLQACLR